MRFYLISDNVDTAMGMRLAGIEGVVVHEDSEVRDALTKAMDYDDVAVILMTERLVSLCPDLVYNLKAKPQTTAYSRNSRQTWKRSCKG